VLRRGGNAVDAAVATGFAMAVTYPRAGNIGGGGFMIIHSAERQADVAIDYRETAPGAMTRDIFLGSDGKPDIAKSRDSALGIGVPGTVAGLTLALEKYGSGKFTLADLLKPAINLARDGFVLNRRLCRYPCRAGIGGCRAGRHRQRSFPAPTARRCAKATRLFRSIWPRHSRRSQHRDGRGFYEGPVAEKLAAGVRDAGGIMTNGDLKSYQAVVRAPVRGSYRGYDILAMPQPSSGGVVLLEMLNILEGFPMREMKQSSAPSLHVMIEAMKRGYADRARYLGDPAFVNAPVATLISKDYAARQRASIDPDRATTVDRCAVGDATARRQHTTHFSVVDGPRQCGQQHLYAEFQLWRRPGRRRYRRSAQQRTGRFHRGAGRFQCLWPRRVRGQPARSGQAATVLDVADHRAEGRQAGAGDGVAGRQPHHLHRAAGDCQCARLWHGRRGGGGGAAATSSMVADEVRSSAVSPTTRWPR